MKKALLASAVLAAFAVSQPAWAAISLTGSSYTADNVRLTGNQPFTTSLTFDLGAASQFVDVAFSDISVRNGNSANWSPFNGSNATFSLAGFSLYSQSALGYVFRSDSALTGEFGVTLTALPPTGSRGIQFDATFAAVTSPVPEPETYALMLAGLGVVGWAARRRKPAAAAPAQALPA